MGYVSHYILMEYNLFLLLHLMIPLPFSGIVISPSLFFISIVGCKIPSKRWGCTDYKKIVVPRALLQINPLPHSLNVGVSLRVDHEAPVYVLLDGVEPPELPGHDHEDGGDIDQNQALSHS